MPLNGIFVLLKGQHIKAFYMCWPMRPFDRVHFTEHFGVPFAFFSFVDYFLCFLEVGSILAFVLKTWYTSPALLATPSQGTQATGSWASRQARATRQV